MDEIIYLAQNPWKSGQVLEPPALDRLAFQHVEGDIARPEILILLGPRQTGKTTLLKEMARRVVTGGICRADHVHYLDLDTMRCADVLESNRSLRD